MVREVEPGELIAIDEDGLRSTRFAAPEPKGCLFEYVYIARPDTTIAGRNVHAARVQIGRQLAKEHPVEADLVIPVPESGTPAAIGYAEESGITYGAGLMKNPYVGRTFIQPSQTLRQLGIRLKLNPLRENVRGKRLVVVDDSIVRGNTQRAIVRMLREAGALEVHVRISSPPVNWPCFYGIDFATRAELLANGLDNEGIRRSIGADTLGYVSLAGLIAATEQPKTRLCRACFDGEYPIELPAGEPDRQARARRGRPPGRRRAASGRRRAGHPCARRQLRAALPTPTAHSTDPTRQAGHRTGGTARTTKGRTVTHVSERSGAGSSPTGAGWRPPALDGRQPAVGAQTLGLVRRRRGVDRGGRPRGRAAEVQGAGRPGARRCMGDLGGFAGLFRLDTKKYKNPILASSTDGVGTKLVIAQQLDIHDTVGIDLVAMVVDDLVACGAEPLFLLDYIATGEVVPDKVAEIGAGIADGCRYAGCALLGGETAEHPGVLRPTSTTSPRPASAWSRRARSSARSGSRWATWSSPCAPPACTPTATRWSGTCCSARAGCGWTR